MEFVAIPRGKPLFAEAFCIWQYMVGFTQHRITGRITVLATRRISWHRIRDMTDIYGVIRPIVFVGKIAGLDAATTQPNEQCRKKRDFTC